MSKRLDWGDARRLPAGVVAVAIVVPGVSAHGGPQLGMAFAGAPRFVGTPLLTRNHDRTCPREVAFPSHELAFTGLRQQGVLPLVRSHVLQQQCIADESIGV